MSVPSGCKYATKEEAKRATAEKVKQKRQENIEKYRTYQREYHREYQRKFRERKRELEQKVVELENHKPKIIITPNFIMEIIDH